MLVIRLARFGRKNRPAYRVVVQEKRRAPSSKLLEIVGNYQPLEKPAVFAVNADRVRYWIGHGAQASDSLHNLLVEHRIIEAKKRVVAKAKKKPSDGAESASGAPAATPAAA